MSEKETTLFAVFVDTPAFSYHKTKEVIARAAHKQKVHLVLIDWRKPGLLNWILGKRRVFLQLLGNDDQLRSVLHKIGVKPVRKYTKEEYDAARYGSTEQNPYFPSPRE